MRKIIALLLFSIILGGVISNQIPIGNVLFKAQRKGNGASMAIDQNLTKIKNAIYGEEVRDAIHDSILECYEDTVEGHDAKTEVVNARTGKDGTVHSSLKARLDNEANTVDSIGKNAYIEFPQTIEPGVKNKWSVDNFSSANYHVLVNVAPGEKYLINGSGINANYPLYVIYNSTSIIDSSPDTTFAYVKNIEITIPDGATTLVVNGRNKYDPYIRKYSFISNYDLEASKQNFENLLTDRLSEYSKILIDVQENVYSTVIPNEYAQSGYNAIIKVNAGEQYKVSGSGYGVYHGYILYDINMSIVSSGGTDTITDYELTIPIGAYYLRVQNNRGSNIIIKKRLKNAKKNIIWLGDSYTAANSLGNEDRDKRFSTLVSNRLGLQEFNYAVGGNGLFPGNGKTDTFLKQITNCAGSMTAQQRSLTKQILICGGRNDPYNAPNSTQADFDDAVNELFSFIDMWYPGVEVIAIPYLWDATYMNNTYYTFYKYYVNSLKKHNCRIITHAYTWLTGLFSNILADGVHPDVEGHSVLTDYIYHAIVGSEDINIQDLIVPGTGAKMYSWSFVRLSIIDGTTLNIYSSMNLQYDAVAGDILAQYEFGNEKKYRPYTGNTSISMFATNLSNGNNYPIAIVYDESNTENYIIKIVANSSMPSGTYLINYTKPYGHI